MALDNGTLNAPIGLSRTGRFCLAQFLNLECLGYALRRGRNFLPIQPYFFFIIRLVPGDVVMDGIDMCGKSPIMGEWIYGIK